MSECDDEALVMRRPCPTRGYCATWGVEFNLWECQACKPFFCSAKKERLWCVQSVNFAKDVGYLQRRFLRFSFHESLAYGTHVKGLSG